MIKTYATSVALLFTVVASCAPFGSDDPVVLKGLDPIQLAAGKEVQGKPELHFEFGGFRYLFANEADLATFKNAPRRLGVQNDGKCMLHPEMKGDPNLYLVSNHKIYLAGDEMCLAEAKKIVTHRVQQLANRKKVAIMLFPGVQIIDYTGPYEVLGAAGFEVFTVAEKAEPLTTNMGMVVTPTYTFANCPKPDILVLPGGTVPQVADASDPQVTFVKSMVPNVTYTMSVCNGAFWLANAGLLDGKQATTFYGMLDDMKNKYPKVQVIDDKKYADNGSIICTAGLSSGIEGALHMVEKVNGLGEAKAVALNMEYNWQPDHPFTRGAFADKYLRKVMGRTGIEFGDGVETAVADVSGDRDQWDKSWSVKGKDLTQQAVMDTVKKQLSTGWTLGNSESDGVEKTTWTFSDENGKPWSAEATVVPDSEKGKFVLKIHLQRASA